MYIEEIFYVYNYNENHDEKGLFSSSTYSNALNILNSLSLIDFSNNENKYYLYNKENKLDNFIKEKFNLKPNVVSFSDEGIELWKSLNRKNYDEIFRVVEKKEYGLDYLNEGIHIGNGKHGLGHYFFNDENKANSFIKDNKFTLVGKISKKDTISKFELDRLKRLYLEKSYNAGIDDSKIVENDGIFGSILNIKAIKYKDNTVLVLDRNSTTILENSL